MQFALLLHSRCGIVDYNHTPLDNSTKQQQQWSEFKFERIHHSAVFLELTIIGIFNSIKLRQLNGGNLKRKF